MTREEAKKAILDKAKNDKLDKYGQTIHLLSLHTIVEQIYDEHEASDKSKDERIAELEAMVEKMKCCENCLHFDPIVYCLITKCKEFSEWECNK